MVRAMLRTRQAPERFWPSALNAVVYLKNRTPHQAINSEIPMYKAFGRSNIKELQELRVFDCSAFVSIPKFLRKGKGGDVRWRGVMVGYSTKSPEYLIYYPNSQRIRTAYSAIFLEDICGFTNKRINNRPEKSFLEENTTGHWTPPLISEENTRRKEDEGEDSVEYVKNIDQPNTFATKWAKGRDVPVPELESNQPSTTSEGNNCVYLAQSIPLEVALKGPEKLKWQQAIDQEIAGLKERNTFGDEPCPEKHKPLDTRYVLSKKKTSDGTHGRYKARLVVKGYRQKFGINYHETFSPVIKLDIL